MFLVSSSSTDNSVLFFDGLMSLLPIEVSSLTMTCCICLEDIDPLDDLTKAAVGSSQEIGVCMAWLRNSFDPEGKALRRLTSMTTATASSEETNGKDSEIQSDIAMPNRLLPLLLSGCGHKVCSECLYHHAVLRFEEHGVDLMDHAKRHQTERHEQRSQSCSSSSSSSSDDTGTSIFTYGLPCPHASCVELLSDAESRTVLSRGESAWVAAFAPGEPSSQSDVFQEVDMLRANRYESLLRDKAIGGADSVSGPRPCRGRGCEYLFAWEEAEEPAQRTAGDTTTVTSAWGDFGPYVDDDDLPRLLQQLDIGERVADTAIGVNIGNRVSEATAPRRYGLRHECPRCRHQSCARCGRYPYHSGMTCLEAACADGQDYEGRASVWLAVPDAMSRAPEGSAPGSLRTLHRRTARQPYGIFPRYFFESDDEDDEDDDFDNLNRALLASGPGLDDRISGIAARLRRTRNPPPADFVSPPPLTAEEQEQMRSSLGQNVQQAGEGGMRRDGLWRCRCGALIERTQGCNKIRCVCGHAFCYLCGKTDSKCGCGIFEGTSMSPDGVPDLEELRERMLQRAAMRHARGPIFPPYMPRFMGFGFTAAHMWARQELELAARQTEASRESDAGRTGDTAPAPAPPSVRHHGLTAPESLPLGGFPHADNREAPTLGATPFAVPSRIPPWLIGTQPPPTPAI